MWGIIRGKAGGWYDRGQITDRLHKSSGLYESPSVVNVDAESKFADFDAEAEARWRFIRWVGVNIVIASGQRPFEIIWPSRRPATICPFSSQLNDCQQTDLFSLGKTSKIVYSASLQRPMISSWLNVLWEDLSEEFDLTAT